MYTIGEISKIVRISANALRYYDEIGLFKPIATQNDNQYRYYSDTQVKDIMFIMELKQYGFTLIEIKELMQNKNNQKFKQMLEQKRTELNNEMTRIKCSSILLEKRISEIIKEDALKMKGGKILIVDDLELVRMMIKNIIEEYGYTAIGEASNGKEAIAAYEKLKPDLVIMDVTMPIMDGIDAVINITNKYKDAKIIMCSAMSNTRVILESIKAGARDFVSKPLSSLRLMDAVVRGLDDNYIVDKDRTENILDFSNDINCKCMKNNDHSVIKSSPLEEKIILTLKDKFTDMSEKLSTYFTNKFGQASLVNLLTIESITLREFKTLINNNGCIGSIKYKTQYSPVYINVYGEFKDEQVVLSEFLSFLENNLQLALTNQDKGDIFISSDYFKVLNEDYRTVLISFTIEFGQEDKGFIAISIPHSSF